MKKITTNKLAGSLLALGLLAAASNQATAATWANTLADGDINNAGNWTGGLPSDAGGNGANPLSPALRSGQQPPFSRPPIRPMAGSGASLQKQITSSRSPHLTHS